MSLPVNPTGSNVERVMRCLAAAVDSGVDVITDFAEGGTAVHGYLSEVGRIGRDAALARVPARFRERCEAIPLDELPTDPAQFAHEVAIAWDVSDTARELHRGGNRDYRDVRPSEFVLTIDVVGLDAANGRAFVGDFKTGYHSVTDAGENWQLRLGALAAARLWGVDRVDVAILYVREDHVYWDRATLDAFDLAVIADELRELAARIADMRASGEPPRLVRGSHCRYCRSFDGCPAQTAMAMAILGANAPAQLTPEAIYQLRAWLTEAGAVMTRLREVIADAVAGWPALDPDAPVPAGAGYILGNGKVFGKWRREAYHAGAVEKVLARHDPKLVPLAVEMVAKTSKEGVKRAARALAVRHGKPTTIAGWERQLRGEIAAEGGLTGHVRLEARKPRALLPVAAPETAADAEWDESADEDMAREKLR